VVTDAVEVRSFSVPALGLKRARCLGQEVASRITFIQKVIKYLGSLCLQGSRYAKKALCG
jgi:hypothetical protein